jgi:hypothetical protein
VRNRKHGMKGTTTYRCWSAMKNRCQNPRTDHYEYWGGAGVRVCERWKKFENFFADMGERPSLSHSLDRFPDKNGDYEPGNVRWATDAEQMNNRRDNIFVEAFGRRMTTIDWSRETGVRAGTIKRRLARGWDPDRAVSAPPGPSRWNRHRQSASH